MNAQADLTLAARGLRGVLRHAEPMARYTAWGVGGPAERFYEPADVDDLAAFLAALPAAEPIFWLGLGSNLLVRDGGIRGTVIRAGRALGGIERTGPGTVRAGAGAACAQVARLCARAGLGGAEFLAGIPGTMGGALAMNAGAFGGETWEVVCAVQTVDRAGRRRRRVPSEYGIGYRQVTGPAGEWFVAAELALAATDAARSAARIRELLRRRGESQPTGSRNSGSVFRNPAGDFAGRLIERAGLKGRRVGGAQVSEKHANFIINTGGATAADIEALIGEVTAAVERAHGVRLQPEVRIVGESPRGPAGEGPA